MTYYLKNSSTQKSSGFSLIELMVVVAIIGILATIAVPNYQKFQARSRQFEAKSMLSAAFTAQKTFHGEYGTYTTCFNSTGFIPENTPYPVTVGIYPQTNNIQQSYGIIATGLGFWGENPTPHSEIGLPSSPCTGQFSPHPSRCFINSPLSDGSGWNVEAPVWSDIQLTGLQAGTTTTQFRINALGCPKTNIREAAGRTLLDRWSIDDKRVLTNSQSGI